MGNPEHDEEGPAHLQLNKRMLQKHGWRFVMIEKANNSKQPQNKRALSLYNQRENIGDRAPSRLPPIPMPQVIDTRAKPEDQTFNFSMVH